MHVWLQLALVLFVLFCGLLSISISQKRLTFKSGALFLLILCLSLGAGYLGLKAQRENRQKPLVEAGAILQTGDFQKALAKLTASGRQDSRDSLWSLYKARLFALNGNKRAAAYYYALVENALQQGKRLSATDKDSLEEELDAFHKSYSPNSTGNGEQAFAQYLVDSGLNPEDYGVKDNAADKSNATDDPSGAPKQDNPTDSSQSPEDSLKDIILSNTQDEVDNMASLDTNLAAAGDRAALVAQIEQMVETGGQTLMKTLPDNSQKEIKLADLVDEGSDLYAKDKADAELSKALVEASVMLGDYDKAKEILIETPVADNLAVLSELIMSGKVQGSDLQG
ncbi:MAG: hypothetical protein N2376_12295, partial [Clostridia bacterium]|nr:hypothetical protein [Clostridia bacterium]